MVTEVRAVGFELRSKSLQGRYGMLPGLTTWNGQRVFGAPEEYLRCTGTTTTWLFPQGVANLANAWHAMHGGGGGRGVKWFCRFLEQSPSCARVGTHSYALVQRLLFPSGNGK